MQNIGKLICNRLNWWMEYYKIIPNSQFGFRRNRACIDNIAILYFNIIKTFKMQKSLSALFLDIQAAYDNVLSDILINNLMKLGIPQEYPRSLKFIYHIIASRLLPQGSVLSPLLYAIYVKNLDKLKINNLKYFNTQMMLHFFHDLVQKKLDDLKLTLEKINEFLNHIGLELSSSKTKLCIFSYGLRKTENIEITMYEMCVKTLSKIIKCLKYTWWGADPRVLINLYIALIRSRIEYRGFLFHNLFNSSSLKLMRLQYKALRLALELRNSTPNIILAKAKNLLLTNKETIFMEELLSGQRLGIRQTNGKPSNYYFPENIIVRVML
ncbi:hypothetical protein ACFW04_013612 [Cataglyphis niger]